MVNPPGTAQLLLNSLSWQITARIFLPFNILPTVQIPYDAPAPVSYSFEIVPNCFEPHYESEAKCKVFIVKISFHSSCSSANKTNFQMKKLCT